VSNEAKTTLSREKIQQLLVTVGQNKPKDDSEISATDYDWNQPHFFNAKQLEKLNEFAKTAADVAAERFEHFFQANFKVDTNSIKQHYAGYFVSRTIEDAKKAHYLTLKDSQNSSCGLTVIPAQTANNWLNLLLGDSESRDETEGQLSKLETSLLADITKSLAGAITGSSDKLKFQPDSSITSNTFSLDIGAGEELLEIAFDIQKDGSEDKTQLSILLPCKALLPIAGKIDSTQAMPAKDLQNVILKHLNKIPVVVDVQLASTELTFEQIFTLQSGDILLLGKKINEPLSLIVEGQKRFLGRLAKSQGKLATVIDDVTPTQNKGKQVQKT
jgi:flagellar motor switch protein FliM